MRCGRHGGCEQSSPAILARLLPGRLVFWAFCFGRQPTEDTVGNLELFLEPVVFEYEVTVAVDDTSAKPGVDGLAAETVRGTGVDNAHALVTNFTHDFRPYYWVGWFAFGHAETVLS